MQCLLLFVFGSHVGNAFGGCGDYLHHKGSFHFTTGFLSSGVEDVDTDLALELVGLLGAGKADHLPVSRCSGGNCRSAPEQPPVEPSRTIVSRRQPVGLQISSVDLELAAMSSFGWLNDRLPMSIFLEVATPPPIFSA